MTRYFETEHDVDELVLNQFSGASDITMVTHHYDADMLSVEEAKDRVLAMVPVLEAEERPLLEALGQVLAEDVSAGFDIPPLDNSAMDGYAVRHQDVRGAGPGRPVLLRVIGSLAAGQLPQREVTPGAAIRIMTGAPVPPGADTIVPFEETDEVERRERGEALDQIGIRLEVALGRWVRPAGEDVSRGQEVLARGTVLRPGEIGVLASLGWQAVRVIRRPEVAILATGDELLEPGEPLRPGMIYDSNSYGLAASVLRYGGRPRLLGIARDTREAIHRKLDQGLAADMLVTSAGVSKGDYDMVKDVLAERGEIAFWSIRMRPAKPMAFGLLRGPGDRQVPHLGLPGNPVSALVAFEELVRPAVLKMLGHAQLEKPTICAILEGALVNDDARRVFARVVVSRREGTYYARLAGGQGSNLLTSMARANGLAICPEDVSRLEPGQEVEVRMLDWSQEVVL